MQGAYHGAIALLNEIQSALAGWQSHTLQSVCTWKLNGKPQAWLSWWIRIRELPASTQQDNRLKSYRSYCTCTCSSANSGHIGTHAPRLSCFHILGNMSKYVKILKQKYQNMSKQHKIPWKSLECALKNLKTYCPRAQSTPQRSTGHRWQFSGAANRKHVASDRWWTAKIAATM